MRAILLLCAVALGLASSVNAQAIRWVKSNTEGGVSAIVATPDNRLVISSNYMTGLLLFWDVNARSVAGRLQLPVPRGEYSMDLAGVTSMDISGDGRIAVASTDSALFVIDVDSRSLLRTIRHDTLAGNRKVRMNETGDTLLVNAATGVVAKLLTATGALLEVYSLPAGPYDQWPDRTSVAIERTLRRVAVKGYDSIHVVDTWTKEQFAIPERFPGSVELVGGSLIHSTGWDLTRIDLVTGLRDTFTIGGRLIMVRTDYAWVATDDRIEVWSLSQRALVNSLSTKASPYSNFYLTEDNRLLFEGRSIMIAPVARPLTGYLTMHSIEDETESEFNTLLGGLTGVSISPTSGRVFATDDAGGAHEVGINTGSLVNRVGYPSMQNEAAYGANYTPEGTLAYMLTGTLEAGYPKHVVIGAKSFTMPLGVGSNTYPNKLLFEPGSRRYTFGLDFYHRDSAYPYNQLNGHYVTTDFAPNANYVWSRFNDTLVIQQPTGARTYKRLKFKVGSLAVHPDGSTIAVGGEDGIVRLFDSQGDSVNVLLGHQQKVTSLSFTKNGSHLASASLDSTIMIWDVGKQQLAYTYSTLRAPYTYVQIAPDQRTLVASYEGVLVAYETGAWASVRSAKPRSEVSIAFDPVRTTLRVSGGPEAGIIELCDILGRIVTRLPYTRDMAHGLPQLDRGAYLARVQTGGSTASVRVVR